MHYTPGMAHRLATKRAPDSSRALHEAGVSAGRRQRNNWRGERNICQRWMWEAPVTGVEARCGSLVRWLGEAVEEQLPWYHQEEHAYTWRDSVQEKPLCTLPSCLSDNPLIIPTVSPLMIPLVYCHINSFQRASSMKKLLPGGEKRRDGRAAHHVEW